MQRALIIVAAAALMLALNAASAQSQPSAARSREAFAGNLMVLNNGAPQSVAVDYRSWFIPAGVTTDELSAGAGGNLVVEVASGMVTAVIDGQRQSRQFGEFFLVPAGQKLQIITTNRSAIVHTLQLRQ